MTCVALMVPGVLLSGCHSLYIQAKVEQQKCLVPLSAFEAKKGQHAPKAIIALHDSLPFPLLVVHDETYRAFEMRCTHQGAELQFSGSRLTCPAHGSEFSLSGSVLNGPAAEPLRELTLILEPHQLQIQLT